MDAFFRKDRCDRCGVPLRGRTMSRFNTDCLCMECAEAERAIPGYREAVEAEREAVRRGDCNFEGIGLPKDWRKYTGGAR